MTQEKAQQPGYSRGYAAGRRKTETELQQSAHEYEAATGLAGDFWRAAFLAALPYFLETAGWKIGGKEVTSMEDRIELARRAADRSVGKAQEARRL